MPNSELRGASSLDLGAIEHYRNLWRHVRDIQGDYHAAFKMVLANPPDIDRWMAQWLRLSPLVREVAGEWRAAVNEGQPFGNRYTEFQIAHPGTLLGTIVLRIDGEVEARESNFYHTYPTMLNLVRCARRFWPEFSDDERQRTVEVLTGCVASHMQARPHRHLEDLPTEVQASLLQLSPPIRFMRLICNSNMENADIQSKFLLPIVAPRCMVWWHGYRGHAPGLMKDPLRRIDRMFGPKKKQESDSDEDFTDESTSELSDWYVDSHWERDPVRTFEAHAVIAQVSRNLGASAMSLLQMKADRCTREEMAEQMGVSSEAAKKSLSRVRKKARAIPELAGYKDNLAKANRRR